MAGVRGFADPNAPVNPAGRSVFEQSVPFRSPAWCFCRATELVLIRNTGPLDQLKMA